MQAYHDIQPLVNCCAQPLDAGASQDEGELWTCRQVSAKRPQDGSADGYSANKFLPRIWLKGGGANLGQLIFMPNGATLPADNMSSGQVDLYYHLDDFQNTLDLLRNESPMYLLYSGSGGGFENGIKTTTEAIGEGES